MAKSKSKSAGYNPQADRIVMPVLLVLIDQASGEAVSKLGEGVQGFALCVRQIHTSPTGEERKGKEVRAMDPDGEPGEMKVEAHSAYTASKDSNRSGWVVGPKGRPVFRDKIRKGDTVVGSKAGRQPPHIMATLAGRLSAYSGKVAAHLAASKASAKRKGKRSKAAG